MNLLSIQSHVVYGHVGNAAAVFALQRLGVEVWPINTVQLSNHPGYGAFAGRVFDAAMIRELADGVGTRGAFEACDGVLSGYVGTREIAEMAVTERRRRQLARDARGDQRPDVAAHLLCRRRNAGYAGLVGHGRGVADDEYLGMPRHRRHHDRVPVGGAGTGIVGNTTVNGGGTFAAGNGTPGSSMTVSGGKNT